jgi:hypothetical protein
LLIVGGGLYSLGAIVYGFKRPDPHPRGSGTTRSSTPSRSWRSPRTTSASRLPRTRRPDRSSFDAPGGSARTEPSPAVARVASASRRSAERGTRLAAAGQFLEELVAARGPGRSPAPSPRGRTRRCHRVRRCRHHGRTGRSRGRP